MSKPNTANQTKVERENFKILFSKYLQNKCNEEELKILFYYFDTFEKKQIEVIREEIEKEFFDNSFLSPTNAELEIFLKTENELAEELKKQSLAVRSIKIRRILQIAAACIIISFISITTYFQTNISSNKNNVDHTKSIQSILPGKEKAILTLSSGKEIDLNSLKNGQTVKAEGVNIVKENNGELRYEFTEVNTSIKQQNHTISTPKGGRYQLTLVDGTRVWLNSSSKLTFPTSFLGNNRKVELIGEGYFEVAKNKEKPFLVYTEHQMIEVTGTRFNVASYSDDRRISTTLVEGQVIINSLGVNNERIVLRPGQKAILNTNKSSVSVESANIEEAISWKNGWFVFEDMTLKEILKKASRWYEIEINYSTIPHSRFSGAIPMNVKLSKLIEILEKTSELRFEINNNQLTVTKKPM